MAISIESNKSLFVALTAVFAAMIAVLDVIPMIPGFYGGIWDSWAFMLSPLVGALLGPYAGAVAVGIGSLTGHFIYFRDPFELVFQFGAPLGAAMGGFVYQKRWKPALGIYSVMLLGYFLEPVSWILPLWGIWDTLVGYGVLLVFVVFTIRNWWPKDETKQSILGLLLTIIIGLESDILFRIFVLVPGQTYWLFYGFSPEVLQMIWLGAGIITPIKVVLAAIAGLLIGLPLLRILKNQFGQVENMTLSE
jgi:hypothetical protein